MTVSLSENTATDWPSFRFRWMLSASSEEDLTLPRKSGHIDSTPLRVIGVIDGVTQTTGIHGRFQG